MINEYNLKKFGNDGLNKTKIEKSGELYIKLSDVEKEFGNYVDHFENKIIYCNYISSKQSTFYKYFSLNFDVLKLKKLITIYCEENNYYKLEVFYDALGNKVEVQSDLVGNGDFRSEECIELLKECDIVVTNPPFSLFREYVLQLVEYNKKFLIIGNQNVITHKDIFPLFKNDEVWCGVYFPREFVQENGIVKSFGNIQWYTNIENKRKNEMINLYRTYNELDYPKYDNIDAINVDKVNDIPCDYFEPMGVPSGIIARYNPKQFRLLDANNSRVVLNGCKIYTRVIIQRIKE